jgi:hypothetical protein
METPPVRHELGLGGVAEPCRSKGITSAGYSHHCQFDLEPIPSPYALGVVSLLAHMFGLNASHNLGACRTQQNPCCSGLNICVCVCVCATHTENQTRVCVCVCYTYRYETKVHITKDGGRGGGTYGSTGGEVLHPICVVEACPVDNSGGLNGCAGGCYALPKDELHRRRHTPSVGGEGGCWVGEWWGMELV